MPHTRMIAALSMARSQSSDPQQFCLSHVDYRAFVAVPHPLVTVSGSRPDYFFDTVNVVRATDPTSVSLLHVLGSLPGFTNPIAV